MSASMDLIMLSMKLWESHASPSNVNSKWEPLRCRKERLMPNAATFCLVRFNGVTLFLSSQCW